MNEFGKLCLGFFDGVILMQVQKSGIALAVFGGDCGEFASQTNPSARRNQSQFRAALFAAAFALKNSDVNDSALALPGSRPINALHR